VENSFESMLTFFKALSSEGRLRLVGVLAKRPSTVRELATALGLGEPTVCHHLRRLEQAGLVHLLDRHYVLKVESLRKLGESILGKNGVITSAVPDEVSWEQRVLQIYVAGEALTKIPASRRKRWAILRWLAEKFEEGPRYPEAEVNELIQRHHWDSATLRREMVGYKMLDRSNGQYWRRPREDWLPAAS
jgi:hypothetical protein